jgi:hypothetical protein
VPTSTTLKVFVLTKTTLGRGDEEDVTNVLGVYCTRDDVEARVDRIRQANSQYPMRKAGDNVWFLGPEDDEGFFGHRPITLRVSHVPLHFDSRREALDGALRDFVELALCNAPDVPLTWGEPEVRGLVSAACDLGYN